MKRVDALETEVLSAPVELTENALASEFTRRYLEELRYVHEDSAVDISDAVALLGFLFLGDTEPQVIEAADINGDAELDISDSIYLLAYLFGGGPPPPKPFPDPGPAL